MYERSMMDLNRRKTPLTTWHHPAHTVTRKNRLWIITVCQQVIKPILSEKKHKLNWKKYIIIQKHTFHKLQNIWILKSWSQTSSKDLWGRMTIFDWYVWTLTNSWVSGTLGCCTALLNIKQQVMRLIINLFMPLNVQNTNQSYNSTNT